VREVKETELGKNEEENGRRRRRSLSPPVLKGSF
jgi:hypothetical protein